MAPRRTSSEGAATAATAVSDESKAVCDESRRRVPSARLKAKRLSLTTLTTSSDSEPTRSPDPQPQKKKHKTVWGKASVSDGEKENLLLALSKEAAAGGGGGGWQALQALQALQASASSGSSSSPKMMLADAPNILTQLPPKILTHLSTHLFSSSCMNASGTAAAAAAAPQAAAAAAAPAGTPYARTSYGGDSRMEYEGDGAAHAAPVASEGVGVYGEGCGGGASVGFTGLSVLGVPQTSSVSAEAQMALVGEGEQQLVQGTRANSTPAAPAAGGEFVPSNGLLDQISYAALLNLNANLSLSSNLSNLNLSNLSALMSLMVKPSLYDTHTLSLSLSLSSLMSLRCGASRLPGVSGAPSFQVEAVNFLRASC